MIDDNQHAQMAWERYTGRGLARGTGYSVRHIWGHPWDPDAFTAGWNLCYMPFWVGMLPEGQHPHEELELAVRQASWDLYFRNNRVCEPPDFVEGPGLDLSALMAGQPVLILQKEARAETPHPRPSVHLGPIRANPVHSQRSHPRKDESDQEPDPPELVQHSQGSTQPTGAWSRAFRDSQRGELCQVLRQKDPQRNRAELRGNRILGQRVGLVSSLPLSFPSPLPTLILLQKAS